MRSFRLRIALTATVLCGCLILGFGYWSWRYVEASGLERIDTELRTVAQPHVAFPHRPEYWRRVEESLDVVYGGTDAKPYLIHVRRADGGVIQQSENIPPELDLASRAPSGELTEPTPRPPEPGFRRRPPPAPPRGGPGGFRGERPPRRAPPPPPMPQYEPEFVTMSASDHRWRVGVFGNPNVTFILGLSLERFDQDMAAARNAFIIATAVALGVMALAGWWIARRALAPIAALTSTVERVSAKGLDQRIEAGAADVEFKRLIDVFNGMMARLERGFEQATRFSADAAHELKTPLTILQGELERGIRDAPPESDEQKRYSRLLDEVQRLKLITRKLLLLSLADSGQLKPNLEPFDLSAAAENLAEDLRVLEPSLNVEAEIAEGVRVMADAALLTQALQNLASNAAKYSNERGRVRIALENGEGTARFTIANSGPGIPAEDRAKVFQRFYRSDRARSRKNEGTGLGLSLALEIVRAHGGELRLENGETDMTTFALELPAA